MRCRSCLLLAFWIAPCAPLPQSRPAMGTDGGAHRDSAGVPGSGMAGPILGFVFDRDAQALRPILGIPGAATLGAPLDIGTPIDRAAVSPRQDYALAVSAADGSVLAVRTGAAPPAGRAIAGAAASPDRIVLSTGGAAAALYRRDTARAQLIAGLPDAPALVGEVDLSSFTDPVSAMAISDDAGILLVAFEGVETGSVYAFRSAGPQLVFPVRHPTAVRFLNGSGDALIADGVENKIFLVRDAAGKAAVVSLAGADAGIAGPVALQVSADNRKALIANAQAGTITSVDIESGVAASISCGCTPSGLDRLSGDSVFRLNEASRDPLWILDDDRARGPRVVFVPPDPPAAIIAPQASGARQ